MACALADMLGSDCPAVDGGIYVAFAIEGANISDITISSGVITGITLASSEVFYRFEFDRDNTGYYNQTGQRSTLRNHTYQQEAFMKFAGVSATRVASAHGTVDCCNLVWIYFLNNGQIGYVQGIEVIDDSTWRFSKQSARTLVNIMSDTDENEDRVEITVQSLANYPSSSTDLDIAAVDALVGS